MNANDFDLFELRLAAGLRSDADVSLPQFDPALVARTAIAGSPRGSLGDRIRTTLAGLRPTGRLGYALLILGLALTLVVGAVAAGSILRPPPRPDPLPSAMFTATGALAPGWGAAAVRLADGRVLIVGGTKDGQAWLWDPATGVFSPAGRLSQGRRWPMAVLLPDGKVLVAGGDAWEGSYLASAELFDPATKTFRPTGATAEPRGTCHCRGTEYPGGVMTPTYYAGLQRPTAVTLTDGRVFVLGGANALSAEIYDPRTGTFTVAGYLTDLARAPEGQDPPCNANRITATALRDGRVLVKCIASAYLFDPRSDTFTPTGIPATDSVGGAYPLADGRILFTGGARARSTGRAEIYDPTSGTFHAVADATDPSASWPNFPGVVLPDGRVAFIASTAVTVFDPATETFTQLAHRPLHYRESATAAVLDNGLVLIVGPTGSGLGGPQELFNPAGS